MPFFLFTEGLPSLIDLTQPSLYISLISIAAGPILWNAIGRNEYKNKTITKLIGGRVAATILGVIIVLMGLLRDVLYRIALHDQPRYPLPYGIQTVLSWAIFGAANFLVLTSYLALGFYGTFVGDYFGILQPKRVTRFPFNILKDPMYLGATWCYVGAALWYERPVGLLVAAYVYLTYAVALTYESPFTDMIYANHNSPVKKPE